MPRFKSSSQRNAHIRVSVAALLILCAAFCSKQDKIEDLISYEQVDTHIRFLSSDELKGRGSFSEDVRLTEDYIAEQFREAGLDTFFEFPGYRL